MSRWMAVAILLTGCVRRGGEQGCGSTSDCPGSHVCLRGLCVPAAARGDANVPDLAAVDGAVGVFDQSDDLRGGDVDAAPDAVSYDSPGPEVRGAVCGNGVVEEGEACDDGNDLDDDACNNRCTLPMCGNGITESGESCDGGPNLTDDRCTSSCRWVPFRQIAASSHHFCGLRENGLVTCWGVGVVLPPAGPFAEIALGGTAACGLRSDGTAVCWEGSLSPPKVKLQHIAVAGGFACGIERETSLITCWGAPGVALPSPSPEKFTALAAGGSSACGLRATDGQVVCWGDVPEVNRRVPMGSFTDLAVGPEAACASDARTTQCWGRWGNALADVRAPFVGDGFACVLPKTSVYCWPAGPGPPSAPSDHGDWLDGAYTQVAATSEIVCAIQLDGAVACSAASLTGFSPMDSRVRRIYRTPFTTCVDFADHSSRCVGGRRWGLSFKTLMLALADGNLCGLKADGTIECSHGLSPRGTYRQLVAGRHHFCALDFQDRAVCWVEPPDAQLDAPADHFRALSASQDHTCGLTRTGKVVCWGDSAVWGSWPAPAGWFVEVVAGPRANCAVAQDGTVTCWGQGKVVSEPAPRGVNRLSVGESQACGLSPSGDPICWGEPVTWKLPRGPYRSIDVGPIDVGPTTCAIRADGRLLCVGETFVNADHSLR